MKKILNPMKTILKLRTMALNNLLKDKEIQLRQEPEFKKNPGIQHAIDGNKSDLKKIQTFLELTENDSLLSNEITSDFGNLLDSIKMRIKYLNVAKAF